MTTTKTKTALALTCAFSLGAPAFAQQDFSAVEIQTVPVAEGLYMLLGQGGNIGLSTGADGSVIIDTEYAPLSEKIQAAIRQAGGGKVSFVINTHWHGDHTGGNENFAKAGAIIVAQSNVRVRMSTEQNMIALGQVVPPSPPAALPVVTFPNRATFHWNGNTVNVYHVDNAHTDGDSIVHFTNLNAYHMGDTFFNGLYPFIDVSSDGSIDGIIAAAAGVLERSDAGTKIIPGHGPLGNREDLRRYVDVMRQVRARIQSLIDAGRTEDEVVAAKPTAEWDAEWAPEGSFMSPEQFTRLAYQSLSR